jgi:hypothetical protein
MGRPKFSRYVPAMVVAVAVLAVSSTTRADPVDMTCSGGMLLPNGRVNSDHVLSLTIDMTAKTVTVGGYDPLGFFPEFPASPGSPNTEKNEVRFMGKTDLGGWLIGSVDRITGEANISFQDHTPKEEFFSGICKPARKLF